MSTEQEIIVVEAVTQYGIRANGKNYRLSPYIEKAGITPQSFTVGTTISAEVYTGPKGGKSINKFSLANGQAPVAAPVAAPQMPPMPPMPSIPQTTVAATPAPGGVAPVQKASTNGNSNGAVKEDDKMSKADWAGRNREIAVQAIVKSSLESPALGEHVTGKSTPEFMELTRQFVKFNLETYRMAIEGVL